MKHKWFQIMVLAACLAHASNVPAQSSSPAQISKDRAAAAPSNSLALGYRVTTDMLPVFERAQKGMIQNHMIWIIEELGQQHTIDKENAGAWLDGYRRRQAISAEVIESRGYLDVSGHYVFHAAPVCGPPQEGEVQIAQSGFSLRLTFNGREGSTGTIVENQLVVNLGGTVGEVPYLIGEVRGANLELAEQSSECSLALSKQ